MKYRQYQIREVAQADDELLGKVWTVLAKPVDLDSGSNVGFAETDLYSLLDITESFIFPYDNELIEEIVHLARGGQLWSPDIEDWSVDSVFDEKKKRLSIVHRYGMMSNKTSEWGADIP
ncbi:MAG: hypothetical protein IKW82_11540 [Bacteroidales bacterium]|nr:hypothetical protein [Bacteroidales bacterium]